jgi:citrate synthase
MLFVLHADHEQNCSTPVRWLARRTPTCSLRCRRG